MSTATPAIGMQFRGNWCHTLNNERKTKLGREGTQTHSHVGKASESRLISKSGPTINRIAHPFESKASRIKG